MYRFLVVMLTILCVGTLAEIIAVVVWRDYERNGDISPGRAFATVLPYAFRTAPTDAAPEGTGPPAGGLPAPSFGQELPALRQQLLYLINEERVRARLAPLSLDTGLAAQQHAESMMVYGYRSHWDINGLTPQMRYTLAGGAGRVSPNILGPFPSPDAPGAPSWPEALAEAHAAMMSLPEEAANLLNPWHLEVNIGIACNYVECCVVQQFESDHLQFSAPPALGQGVLSLAGEFPAGLELDAIALWYHSYPRPLSLGRLDATYHYGYGQRPATFIRPPQDGAGRYAAEAVTYQWSGGIDPYTLRPDLARSEFPPLQIKVAHSAVVPWTTATVWEQSGPHFKVSADLTETLQTSGAGVYTVQVWGRQGEERVPFTNYTIFVR